MTDSVTNNYSLTQPLVGGDTNTWGGVLNNGTIAVADAALGNTLAVTMTSSNVDLTTSQFQNKVFVVSGTLTGNYSLVIPLSPNSASVACGGEFIVVNNTSGAYTLTVASAGGGTNVTVPQGFTANLYSDGTNIGYCSSGLPGFALACNGNPNGQLAGTAGSVNTNASLAFDYVNIILYTCTSTGPASGAGQAVWTNVVSANLPLPSPQGYLTPVSGTAIITGDSVAATVIYYTPYTGAWAAVHNGTKVIPYNFSQMQLTLSASQAASNIYDVFLVYNSGSPVIGTGPSWTAGGGSITAGSCARGTGAGSTALQRDSVSGLWVNTNAISLIYNTGSGNNTISVSAGQGIYLGSIYMDATNGQISCYRSFGQSRKWGIWNTYNRTPIHLQVGDSSASWSVTASNTPQPQNGNTANSFTTFAGLAEEMIQLALLQKFYVTNVALTIGVGINSTSAFTGTTGSAEAPSVSYENYGMVNASYNLPPGLGINTVYALQEASNVNGVFYGTQANMILQGTWRG